MTLFYKEKEREHFFKECINQKPQLFKASLEAPEEISRKRRGEAGAYAGGRLAGFLMGRLLTALFMSEEDHPVCPALIIPFAHLDFWSQRTDLQSI